MVQLPPQTPDGRDGGSEGGQQEPQDPDQAPDGPVLDLLMGPTGPLGLEASTAYTGYETYIEDGLICLKHKIRNLEKKKLKLKDYQKRLSHGEELNKDQKAAVEKYQEVLHHLDFARELHRTLDGLTQSLLKAQRKAVKKEQAVKMEAERRRLIMVLRVQNLLAALQQDQVQRDLLVGRNRAPHVPGQQLHRLTQLASLLGVQRDDGLSLEDQMERAALAYMDLLEGSDKPAAGTTYKLLKEDVLRLLNCSYFSRLPPPPPPSRTAEAMQSSATLFKAKAGDVSQEFFSRLCRTNTENWKEDFQALREREPPDSWDVEFPDGPSSPQTTVHKPWRGAATLIPKVVPFPSKKQADCKQRKEKKVKGEANSKPVLQIDIPVEVSALPQDPALRKQHLEDLMMKIHGSFSFMQDSVLDGEGSPANGQPRLKRRPSGAPSPLGNVERSYKPSI